MSHRIEVELTSKREDGSWTWRAAGARQPKGLLDGSLLEPDAKVGEIFRVEADFDLDGIVITSVIPTKAPRSEPERLELISSRRDDEPLVTSTLVPKGRGGRDRPNKGGGKRGERRRREADEDPAGRGGRRRERSRDSKKRGHDPGSEERSDGAERSDSEGRTGARRRPERTRTRAERPAKPEVARKPKPKRLRAGRVHRNEVLADLPDEHKPIAEEVLKGGIPGVRQAIEKLNEENKAQGRPEVAPDPLVALAEQLLPRLRTAEWRDRADAALAEIDELDLRDLRSVVVAADTAARDEETRELAERLRQALTSRIEREHSEWLVEVASALGEGRVVGALRLSSRPPKAGAPLPVDLSERLAAAAAAALTPETSSDRFAVVLDALAYSPVRTVVKAEGIPATPSDDLKAAVAKLASRLPQIADQFSQPG